jgi:ATP-dependent DNA helicase RecG
MYSLSDSIRKVPGIGEKTAAKLQKHEIATIQDFLLFLPLRYEDRSHITTIDNLQQNQINTVKAQLVSIKEYWKNQTRITNAVIQDETGRVRCIWFNNKYLKHSLKPHKTYFFSGEYSSYRTLTQPTVEEIKQDQVHTGRLVPLYSQTLGLKQGNLRRFLKEVVDNLKISNDLLSHKFKLMSLEKALNQLHFPQQKESVIKARQRLALEELLALIQQSHQIKQAWQQKKAKASLKKIQDLVPDSLPFELTTDQNQAVKEIIQDLKQATPMNRLLIGDVGSGKTVVAALAARQIIQAGHNAALVAPTKILASQHDATLQKLLPQLETVLLTGDDHTKAANKSAAKKAQSINSKPKLYIGTHAVINQFSQIDPALIIYDEQHRFGVAQRAEGLNPTNTTQPHILTMTATPIPRSYMLTIFSHLNVSLIHQMPFGKKPLKTWYVPNSKKADAYDWVVGQLKNSNQNNQLAMVVCPFIDPSDHEAFSQVPAATEIYEKLQQKYSDQLQIALLHGQQKPDQQQKIIKQLFAQKIDLLVATSIVEVGVDLPQANIMIIEGADRFGLANLHQLRGRVGRQGQASYCVLFSNSQSTEAKKRLKLFAQESDGLKLAELDLQNRGAGDLFGLEQHGLDELRFASWNNLNLIKQAQKIAQQIQKQKLDWQPLFKIKTNNKLLAAN